MITKHDHDDVATDDDDEDDRHHNDAASLTLMIMLLVVMAIVLTCIPSAFHTPQCILLTTFGPSQTHHLQKPEDKNIANCKS